MTTVAIQIVPPKTCWTVNLEEDGEKFEPELLFTGNNEKKSEVIVIDDEIIVPRRKMTIAEGLRPLLTSMKLFGLYFNPLSEDTGDDRKEKSRKWNAYAIYAVAVVTTLWINAIRAFSVFTHEDTFGLTLFNKLFVVSWFVQSAVSQTSFYAASFSGRLAIVFDQVLDDSCARHARTFSTIYAVAAWTIIMGGSTFFVYGLLFSDGHNDYYLAPFQNHIVISNPLIPRVIGCCIIFHVLSAYIFSQATTFVLAIIFSHQFRKVNETLGRLLDNDRRQASESDIEMLRQKHQQISMNISNIDDYLMFSNASAFCCQLFTVVILLYSLIFCHSSVTDPVIIIAYVYKFLTVSFGLFLTAAGGVTVHHYVSIFTVLFHWP